jgi:hypothetical protein
MLRAARCEKKGAPQSLRGHGARFGDKRHGDRTSAISAMATIMPAFMAPFFLKLALLATTTQGKEGKGSLAEEIAGDGGKIGGLIMQESDFYQNYYYYYSELLDNGLIVQESEHFSPELY